ncbi:unnamed protein product [Ectocarpus sp. 4 AP-2014]
MPRFGDQDSKPYRRRASHAGTWYSDSGPLLGQQLTDWLGASAQTTKPGSAVRAIIAPHAGFSYSAQTAASAYAHMDPSKLARVFVLGPSHHVHMRRCAVSTASRLETPIGDLAIDQDVTRQLLATGDFDAMTARMDEDEHSIEMHLPFIKKVMEGRPCTVVAIMIGALSAELEQHYGRILAPYLEDLTNFFIISTDFCHWGSRFRYQPLGAAHSAIHEHISWLDHEGMKLIQSQDAKGFRRYLAEHGNTICGRHPIATFINAMEASTVCIRVTWVEYAQSTKVVSPQDSSVSYASAVLTQNKCS